jgi:hypothetical protein
LSLVKRLKHHGNWIEQTRATLMLVATVVATMTFQAGISPPGGVWQENTKKGSNCTGQDLYVKPTLQFYFMPIQMSTYTSYFTIPPLSLHLCTCVVLLVISGFPLNSKFFIWFFTLAMTTSVASLTLAYLTAVLLVTPDHLFDKVRSTAQRLRNTWIGLVVMAYSLGL